jgi:hypothetical protein
VNEPSGERRKESADYADFADSVLIVIGCSVVAKEWAFGSQEEPV